mgnify:CR=1 FL=1
MVTELPTTPLVGEKLVKVGVATVNEPEALEPLLVAMVMAPVVAQAGTVTVIWVLLLTVGVA